MTSDLQIPAHTLYDEVHRIATQYISAHNPSNGMDLDLEPQDANSLLSMDEENLVDGSVASALSFRTSSLLEHMLDLLQCNRAENVPSLTHRLRPMKWQSILGLLATSGAVDHK